MPDVSVVMSVYNGGEHLRASVESILSQTNVSFEFIIVDDGSVDGSDVVLAQYAEGDARVRLIHQENRGLTRALIRGCAEARGTFIGRQDADDIALPGRLEAQLAEIRKTSGVAMASCGTRFVGPMGELLYEVIQSPESATEHLMTLDPKALRGPSSHGATLFSAELYKLVGGYRADFKVAQDLDLWVRMAEHGAHRPFHAVLQETRWSLNGVSSGTSRRQTLTNRLIVESARLRRAGEDDGPVLERVRSTLSSWSMNRFRSRTEAAYFVGSCLMRRGNRAASKYFLDAIRHNPLHLKSWIRLVQASAMN